MLRQDMTNTTQYYNNKNKLLTAQIKEETFHTQFDVGCLALLHHKLEHLTDLLLKAKATFDDILTNTQPKQTMSSIESDSDSDTNSIYDDDDDEMESSAMLF